jgi:hypothetical protein
MLQHSVQIVHYVGVRDAHKTEALARQPIRSTLIIGALAGVRVSVDLDDQLGGRAEKVGDERANPDLAPELEAVELLRAQRLPKPILSGRCLLARGPDALKASRHVFVWPPHADPSPSHRWRDGPLPLPFRERV